MLILVVMSESEKKAKRTTSQLDRPRLTPGIIKIPQVQ
jgi:hypothetical protein